MAEYDVYGKMATMDIPEIYQNGRYLVQQLAESRIPQDVIKKLDIQAENSFLDIGCGLGLNLFPIKTIVNSASACDHPNVIEKLKAKGECSNVTFYEGDFMDINFDRQFTRMLAYSVLHALPDEEAVYDFIDKALSILAPDGCLLLGDIANVDKKTRFLSSKRGAVFQKEWEKQFKEENYQENTASWNSEAQKIVVINDNIIMSILKRIRAAGFHAYLLDQPQDLPFGNSREDILIISPEYKEKK